MFKKLIVPAMCAVALSGCKVTPTKISYTQPIEPQKISVYSVIPQVELEAIYPVADSSAVGAQFGLIGSLVAMGMDASANRKNAQEAEDNLLAIRNELMDLNFDQLFEEEIRKKLSDNVNIDKVQTFKSYEELEEAVQPGETFFVLNTSYKMDMDFRTPFIVTGAALKQKNVEDDKYTIHYNNLFTYFGDSLPAPVKSPEFIKREIQKINREFNELSDREKKDKKNIGKRNKQIIRAKRESMSLYQANQITAHAWSTEYKEELAQNLREGIQDLFTIISEDMRDQAPVDSYAKAGVTLEGYPSTHKSLVIRETDDDVVIRFTTGPRAGSVCIMPKVNDSGKIVCL